MDLSLTLRVFLRVLLRFSFLIKIGCQSITSGCGRIPSIGITSGILLFYLIERIKLLLNIEQDDDDRDDEDDETDVNDGESTTMMSTTTRTIVES